MGLYRHIRQGLCPPALFQAASLPVSEADYLQKPGFTLLFPASCFLPAPPESCPRQDFITAAVTGKHRWSVNRVALSLHCGAGTPHLDSENTHSADSENHQEEGWLCQVDDVFRQGEGSWVQWVNHSA